MSVFAVSVWYYFYLCFEMNSKKGGKRVLQVSPTDANKSAKKKPPNKSFTCPVCEEFIKDSSATSDGQDSILCEGTCSTWLHRKCAGLSKKAFQNVCSSNKPFLCPHCVINKHEEEITSLKSTIQVLTSQISSIQAKLSNLHGFCESNVPKASLQVPQQKVAKPSQQSQSPSSFERNYNIVVYGIKNLLQQVDSSLSKNQALIRKLNLLQLSYKHKIWILRKALIYCKFIVCILSII